MPGQGLSTTFTTGCAFGALLATLQAAGIAVEFVTAATWKRGAGLDADKAASLNRARLLFPGASLDRKKDHGRAEALLLAHWALSRSRQVAA
jgi:crossover junction endodeoxyribonuclease RuvC